MCLIVCECYLGKRKFKTDWNNPNVKLSDPFGVTIRSSEFGDIVGNYYRSGSWYINITVSGNENNSSDNCLITSSVNITSQKSSKLKYCPSIVLFFFLF